MKKVNFKTFKDKNTFLNEFKKNKGLFLMLTPGILILLINNYIPMAGLVIAFKRINYAQGIMNSPWVGLKNFEFLFRTTDAFIITRNTILYNAAFIVIGLVVGVSFAIALSELRHRKLAKLYQSTMFLPYFLSMVVVSYIVYSLLNSKYGFVNNTILPALGIDRVRWYSEPFYWIFIIPIVNTWKTIGYGTIIYLAGILGIPGEMYEAANIDGAKKWQQIWYITIPQLKPLMVMLTLLGIGRIFFANFGLFYQVPLDSGQLYSTTNVLDTYVFRGLMHTGNIGMSAAAGFYQSVVGFVLVIISNWIVRKINKSYALY